MSDKHETQTLLQCLRNLNPGWKQKDIRKALSKSVGMVSEFSSGKRGMETDTAVFARKLIADRIDDLTGNEYSYKQVWRIATHYEELTGGADAPSRVDMRDDSFSLEYRIALAIAQRGIAMTV